MARLPVDDPNYWSERLEEVQLAHHYLHQAVFKCPIEDWVAIERRHIKILDQIVEDRDFILEVGCGWGRLLNMLPRRWAGGYLGYDLCPEFIKMAKDFQPKYRNHFICQNILDSRLLDTLAHASEPVKFDLVILISVRPMIIRNLGQEIWDEMETLLTQCSRKILYLEYDVNCEGFLVPRS